MDLIIATASLFLNYLISSSGIIPNLSRAMIHFIDLYDYPTQLSKQDPGTLFKPPF